MWRNVMDCVNTMQSRLLRFSDACKPSVAWNEGISGVSPAQNNLGLRVQPSDADLAAEGWVQSRCEFDTALGFSVIANQRQSASAANELSAGGLRVAGSVGGTVQFRGVPFRVVGRLEYYEKVWGERNHLNWKNPMAFIPISTMQKRSSGTQKLTLHLLQCRHGEDRRYLFGGTRLAL